MRFQNKLLDTGRGHVCEYLYEDNVVLQVEQVQIFIRKLNHIFLLDGERKSKDKNRKFCKCGSLRQRRLTSIKDIASTSKRFKQARRDVKVNETLSSHSTRPHINPILTGSPPSENAPEMICWTLDLRYFWK